MKVISRITIVYLLIKVIHFKSQFNHIFIKYTQTV